MTNGGQDAIYICDLKSAKLDRGVTDGEGEMNANQTAVGTILSRH
jgi:hypothetical protein